MPEIEFPTVAGSTPGYLAVPAVAHGPATIVLQEWWGVDEHIRSICDRLAAAGFYALASTSIAGRPRPSPARRNRR